MTREDAIEVLKDWDGYFIGHSSDDVNEALDMAIKALEQKDWKFYYDHGYAQAKRDLQEPKTDTWSIKDVANTFKKYGLIVEQEPILDKIRAEIIEDIEKYNDIYDDTCHGLRMALDIIDKYKAESEKE